MHVALRRAIAAVLAIALAAIVVTSPALAYGPVVPWTPGATWTPDSDLHSASGLSVWAIDAYMEAMTGVPNLGPAFMEVEREEGINARAFVAAAMHETGGGWSYLARVKNNLFGWMAYDRDPLRSAMSFPSWDASVRYVGRQVRTLYLDPDGRWASMPTLRAIGRTYASDPNWAWGVSAWVNAAAYPSLRDPRLRWGTATLGGPATPGHEVQVRLPVSIPDGFPSLEGLRLQVTWTQTSDALVDPAASPAAAAPSAAVAAGVGPGVAPGASAPPPGTGPAPAASAPIAASLPTAPAATVDPSTGRAVVPGVGSGSAPGPAAGPTGAPATPATPTAISETSGPAAYREGALVATVAAPAAPGRYTVRVDLRDVDGTQLPAAERVSVPAGRSTVFGPYMAEITSPPMPHAIVPGAQVLLDLTVTNTGTSAWSGATPATADPLSALQFPAVQPTSLRVAWRRSGADPEPQVAAIVPVPLAAGQSQTVSLMLVAPPDAGRYALTADVVDPVAGSLASTGYPTYRWAVAVAQGGSATPAPTTRP